MRSQLFRTDPIAVTDSNGNVVVLKDLDGITPVTVFVENLDLRASLRTKFGSKNANLRFEAIDRGSPGNHITVAITAAPSQAFSIVWSGSPYGVSPYPYDPYGSDLTINLRCDEDGIPNQTAAEVMDLLNADLDTSLTLNVSLANGSDGSAHMEAPSNPVGPTYPTVIMAKTNLAGGLDATALAAASVVEVSPTGWPDFAGPWAVHSAAGTALSSIGANSVKSYSFVDTPVKGLRVTLKQGGADTKVVVSAIAQRKF
jgi:hypothetical protein